MEQNDATAETRPLTQGEIAEIESGVRKKEFNFEGAWKIGEREPTPNWTEIEKSLDTTIIAARNNNSEITVNALRERRLKTYANSMEKRILSLSVSSPGSIIDRWLLENQPIAGGGCGQIYRGWDTKMEKRVAIKKIPKIDGSLLNPQNEAKVMAKMELCPGVVQIYDYKATSDSGYLVMEYLDHKVWPTAEELIRNRGEGLKAAEIARIIEALATTMDDVNSKGIIHGDIKTKNIFVNMTWLVGKEPAGESVVKITDFGISSGAFTRKDGYVVGTPDYMSPEVAMGETSDYSSDLFSLGVVAYKLLVGSLPERGSSVEEVIGNIVNDSDGAFISDLEKWAEKNKHPSDELKRIFEKMLNMDPKKRYSTAKDFGMDLKKALEELKSNG